jgi:transcriptional regulator with XRE-family HTH domain
LRVAFGIPSSAEFERQQAEIAAVDAIVNELDGLRERSGMTKAALARAIDKNPAAVRRLLTASGNPELRTVVAIAQALDRAEKPTLSRTSARALCRTRTDDPFLTMRSCLWKCSYRGIAGKIVSSLGGRGPVISHLSLGPPRAF